MNIVSTQRLLPYVLLTLYDTGHIDEQRFTSYPTEFIHQTMQSFSDPRSEVEGYSVCVFENYVYFPKTLVGRQPSDRQALDTYIRKTLNRKEN